MFSALSYIVFLFCNVILSPRKCSISCTLFMYVLKTCDHGPCQFLMNQVFDEDIMCLLLEVNRLTGCLLFS